MPAADPSIHVRAGRHKGATVPLTRTVLHFGNDAASDVILSDEGIEAQHFSLQAKDNTVELVARSAGLHLNGRKHLPAGYRALLTRNTSISTGVVDFDIIFPDPPKPLTARRKVVRTAPVLICVAILASTLSVGRARLAPEEVLVGEVDPSNTFATENDEKPVTPILPDLPAKPPSVATAKEVISAKLSEIGLDALALSQQDRALQVSGELAQDQSESWAAFQRWFDGSFPNLMLQTAAVRIRAAKHDHPPFPKVQSIWSLGRPYVFIDGKRYYVGSRLRDGWTVRSLDGGKVGLDFKGQTYWLALSTDNAEVADEN